MLRLKVYVFDSQLYFTMAYSEKCCACFNQGTHSFERHRLTSMSKDNTKMSFINTVNLLYKTGKLTDVNSGVFRGEPPFGPTMNFFYRRLYMKRCTFLPFSSKNCKI